MRQTIQGRARKLMPISRIRVGRRHRKNIGDVRSLARSIDEIGLLHPVVIRGDGTLIAGERRLRAMKSLGWKEAPVTILDLDQIIKGEVAENVFRKNFLPSEMVQIARTLEPILKKEAKNRQGARTDLNANIRQILHNDPEDDGRTRTKLGAAVGVSGPTLEKMMAVVDAAEQNPRKFGRLLEDMERTGKVTAPYRELLRLRDQQRVSRLKPINGKFRTLIVDPPWEYGEGLGGRKKPPYETMSMKEMRRLPVKQWADQTCHLYLWCTGAVLPEAFELVEGWGFKRKALLTWVKGKWALGEYFRNQAEFVIFAVKGNLGTRSHAISTVFHGPLGKDSEKPDEFYDHLVRRASFGPFGEAFQRKARPGFVNLFS